MNLYQFIISMLFVTYTTNAMCTSSLSALQIQQQKDMQVYNAFIKKLHCTQSITDDLEREANILAKDMRSNGQDQLANEMLERLRYLKIGSKVNTDEKDAATDSNSPDFEWIHVDMQLHDDIDTQQDQDWQTNIEDHDAIRLLFANFLDIDLSNEMGEQPLARDDSFDDRLENYQNIINNTSKLLIMPTISPTARAQAQLRLGEIYYCGKGVQKDYEQARSFFELAANQNEDPIVRAAAQRRLGEIYYFGRGVQEDYKRAREFFELAANQNENAITQAEAHRFLGEIYYLAKGVQKDYERARELFELAANQNKGPIARAAAQRWLGEIYYFGRGVQKDYERARSFFELAANQNENAIAKSTAQRFLDNVSPRK